MTPLEFLKWRNMGCAQGYWGSSGSEIGRADKRMGRLVLRKPRWWHKALLPITMPLYLVATVAIWVYIAGLYLLGTRRGEKWKSCSE